jgi:hypothetical protein
VHASQPSGLVVRPLPPAFIAGLVPAGTLYTFADNIYGTYGWEFNTNRVLQIDALGIFDSNLPGLAGTCSLGIWDSSQNLLTSTTVSGNGDGISNGFVWKSLASILNIAPGNYVVGAFGTWSGDDQLVYGVDGDLYNPARCDLYRGP